MSAQDEVRRNVMKTRDESADRKNSTRRE